MFQNPFSVQSLNELFPMSMPIAPHARCAAIAHRRHQSYNSCRSCEYMKPQQNVGGIRGLCLNVSVSSSFGLSVAVVFSARCVHRTNCRVIAMMFLRLSVCLSIWDGRACIVIIRYTLTRIRVYGWIVQCCGHPKAKACPPTPSRLFPVLRGREVGYGCAN